MSTTMDKITALYARAGALLAHDGFLTEAEQREFADIRAELDQLWPKRRAELVFQVSGPPRCLGGGTERDQQRMRQIAYGIAPLPHGGD